jgi:nitronate monooxygenase
MNSLETEVTAQLGIELPIICGAMYPCSNAELVAAVSEAGGIGVVQPLSLVFVHKHDFREGLRLISKWTSKPVGMNVIVERSSKAYHDRMTHYMDVALEEGIRFFVTSLGNPGWVVDKAHSVGGVVYHDVTEKKWALKGLEAGVDGLIAVNNRAGGHAGPKDARKLFDELAELDVPLVCAGGIGDESAFIEALSIGYGAVQMGTRFIATSECSASDDYKEAIVESNADDIVLTERITGVPVSVIRTPYIAKVGTRAGPLARWMLGGRRTKHWMRMIYSLQSFWKLKKSSHRKFSYRDYLQAGKSVAGVKSVESVSEVVRRFSEAARNRSDLDLAHSDGVVNSGSETRT